MGLVNLFYSHTNLDIMPKKLMAQDIEQDYSESIANAIELLTSDAKPSYICMNIIRPTFTN